MSKVELKETIGCSKKFKIEVERERFDQELSLTLKKIKREVQVPGFRKGKAPEEFILKRFGDYIREETVKDLLPKVVKEVYKEHGLSPVGEPEISELNIDDSGPISFYVKIDELPEIDLTGFEGLKVVKEVQDVTDDNINVSLDRLRNIRAERVEVDRPAQQNDILVANLQKLDSEGAPLKGEKIDNHILILDGHGTPSVEFDKQVIGMVKGDKKTVTFTYDDTISSLELVGTTESYGVELIKVVENRVPELNDEFAKSLGGNIQSVDELIEKSRRDLELQFEYTSRRKLESAIINGYVEKYPFEVPESMVEKIIKSELERIKADKKNGPVNEKDFRDNIRPEAVKAVQTYLIVDAVATQNQIEPSKDEVSDRINGIAAMSGKTSSELRRQMIKDGTYDSVRNDLRELKVYEWLKSKVDIDVETIKPSESN